LLELAFHLTHEAEPLRQKLRHEKVTDYQIALDHGLITEGDLHDLQEADAAVHRAIMVDDFAPEELKPQRHQKTTEVSS
jgi:acyl-CoA dehydrogenase